MCETVVGTLDAGQGNWTMLTFSNRNSFGVWGPVLDTVSVKPVPEPSTVLLFGLGFVGLIGFGRKKLFKKL